MCSSSKISPRASAERTLFEHFDLHLRAGDRVALIGPNGVGKSTLLRADRQASRRPTTGAIRYGANVDIGYYDQQQTAPARGQDACWTSCGTASRRWSRASVRSVLGCFLFTGDDVFQPIRTLSGGEKGRVALTRLMLREG